MGNSINKIDEGFYICGVDALRDFDRLRSLGIKCVLNAAQEGLYSNSAMGYGQRGGEDSLAGIVDNFEVKIIGAEDAEDCNLSVHFTEIADFIQAGRAKGGVVVHCAAGVSRASTSSCAYLMIKENWDLDSAFRRVQSARSFIQPNRGFWRQLRDLEASLKAQGAQFKQLPADYMAPAQPDGGERESMASSSDPYESIKRLDSEANLMESFVTQYLTAVVTTDDVVPPQTVVDCLERDRVTGVNIQNISLKDNVIRLRAGLVPSLDSASFKKILLNVNGVKDAIVE